MNFHYEHDERYFVETTISNYLKDEVAENINEFRNKFDFICNHRTADEVEDAYNYYSTKIQNWRSIAEKVYSLTHTYSYSQEVLNAIVKLAVIDPSKDYPIATDEYILSKQVRLSIGVSLDDDSAKELLVLYKEIVKQSGK